MLVAVSYDVRYSIEGANDWIEVTGITSTAQALSGLDGCNTYEVQMRTTCDGTTTTDWGPSSIVVVPGCGACSDVAFCESAGENATEEWIDRVRIGTIDNTSGGNDGYAAFPEQGTTLEVGVPYPVILTPGFNGGPYNENWSVWIDLDLDGQFEVPGERVFLAEESTAEVTGDLVVPDGAPLGPSRMRVIMKFNNPVADGCEDGYGYGETEDYCVTIIGASGLSDRARTNGLHLFPNPVGSELFVEAVLNGGQATMEVLDNTGKLVLRQNAGQGRITLNTTSFANGLYLLRLVREGREVSREKFEVAHD